MKNGISDNLILIHWFISYQGNGIPQFIEVGGEESIIFGVIQEQCKWDDDNELSSLQIIWGSENINNTGTKGKDELWKYLFCDSKKIVIVPSPVPM